MRSNQGIRVVAATLAVMAAACSSPSTSSAEPTTETLPFPIGQMGVPVQAKSASGATADITLNSAACCNVIELTIAGTSPMPFKYDETFIVAGYGGGDQPFTHANDDHWLGGSPGANYEQIGKLPPLRKGAVTTGQIAHGFVGYSLQSEGDLYIKEIDPDTEHPLSPGPFAVVEAGWKVHT